MKSLKRWIAGSLLTIALMPGAASAMGIEMSVGGWNQDPKGDLSFKADSAQDSLSIKDNLKYSDATKVFGRVKIDMPLIFSNIYLMATPLEYSAAGSKDTSFKFGNTTYNAGAPFTSELKLDHYDVGFYYGVPGLSIVTAGILNVDFGLDARIIDFKTQVTGTAGLQTITEAKSLVIPLPMLYVGVQVKPVKWLAAEAEARGIAYGGNHYYDLIGRVNVKPFGPLFAAGGYRYEKIDIDRDDIKARASFSGPFGEAGVEF